MAEPHRLPDDLAEFYDLCGGVLLFGTAGCPTRIVPPQELVPANPVIVGEATEDDISASWYIPADDLNGDCFTIDLSRERPGRGCDSFWDSHAQPGDCKIVADTFTDFLLRMLDNKGRHGYFLQPEFVSLGDACDGLLEESARPAFVPPNWPPSIPGVKTRSWYDRQTLAEAISSVPPLITAVLAAATGLAQKRPRQVALWLLASAA